MPLEKRLPATAFDAAFLLALGTLAKTTQSAKIAIRLRLQEENIHLVMGHADVPFCHQFIEGLAAGFLEGFQMIEVADPDGQVHVFAFVP